MWGDGLSPLHGGRRPSGLRSRHQGLSGGCGEAHCTSPSWEGQGAGGEVSFRSSGALLVCCCILVFGIAWSRSSCVGYMSEISCNCWGACRVVSIYIFFRCLAEMGMEMSRKIIHFEMEVIWCLSNRWENTKVVRCHAQSSGS